jgi:hypothetical protein
MAAKLRDRATPERRFTSFTFACFDGSTPFCFFVGLTRGRFHVRAKLKLDLVSFFATLEFCYFN